MQNRTLALIGAVALLAGPAAMAQTAGGDRPSDSKQPKASESITVSGCLTKGQTNSFVLTPTGAGDPLSTSVASKTHKVTPTYTYQLTGGQNLDAHVGKIVKATGTLDRDTKATAKVDQERERPADPSAAAGGKKPTVKTEEKAKIEVRQLHVQSVTATGQNCSAKSGT